MVTILLISLLSQTTAPSPQEAEQLEDLGQSAGLTAAIAAKMSGDQLHDVLVRQAPHGDPPAVAMAAVVGFFVVLVVTVLGALYAVLRISGQRAETLRLMVEKACRFLPRCSLRHRARGTIYAAACC